MALKRTDIPWRDLPHLRVKEAAEIAGISEREMERHLNHEPLRLRHIGRIRFVTTRSFCEWIEDEAVVLIEQEPKLNPIVAAAVREMTGGR